MKKFKLMAALSLATTIVSCASKSVETHESVAENAAESERDPAQFLITATFWWHDDNDRSRPIGWRRDLVEELGSTYLTDRPDVDVITVRECGLTHLKMRVQGDNAVIKNLAVQYSNGVWDNLDVKDRFDRGGASRWIDLQGGQRCVTRIAVLGHSGRFSPRQTKIEFVGLRIGGRSWWDRENDSSRPNGWRRELVEDLGTTFLTDRPDVDVINVRECGLSHVKILVRGDSAVIRNLSVQYNNGVWDELDLKDRFEAGGSSRWIDLRGGQRCVTRIAVVGHSGRFSPRQTRVEFVGLRLGGRLWWDDDNDRSRPGNWRRDSVVELGSTFLTNNRDVDWLRVGVCKISHIKMKIQGDNAVVRHLSIRFKNGGWQDIQFKDMFFGPGEASRWIDLKGNERCIESIAVIGQSGRFNPRQTKVEFVGFKHGH